MNSVRKPLSHYLALEYSYTVVPDDGSYFIEFPDLPGCMTQVEATSDIPQAAEEIRRLWLESAVEDTSLPIPEPVPTEYSGKLVVRMPRSLHRELAERAKREGVSLNTWILTLLAGRMDGPLT